MIEILKNMDEAIELYNKLISNLVLVHEDCTYIGIPNLAEAALNSANSLNDLVDVLLEIEEDMLDEMGAIKVPIKNHDKPDLKLVVNNGPIGTDPHNP